MKSISIYPFERKSNSKKNTQSSISIKVYVGAKIIHSETIKHKINIGEWDPDKRIVKSINPLAAHINHLISQRINELKKSFVECELSGQKLTAFKIKKISKGEDLNLDFVSYCKQRIPIRYPNESQHETRRYAFTELTKVEHFRKDIAFGDIDYDFLSGYKHWMITVRKNQKNTVWKSLKFLNTMLNDAKKNGIIKENPFSEFDRGRYEQGNRKFIEISDCDKIFNVLQTNIPDRLRLVGIYYLFMCYTGFRFQDATHFFDYNNHVVNNECIVMKTQKQETEVQIFIHDRLRVILDFIKYNPIKISNREFNSYSKVLGTLAGIEVPITAHTGRHTFGSILAELDIPIEKSQKLLGHKDIDSTKIYYHIKNKSLHNEMKKWNTL